jgi:hypothetical protein
MTIVPKYTFRADHIEHVPLGTVKVLEDIVEAADKSLETIAPGIYPVRFPLAKLAFVSHSGQINCVWIGTSRQCSYIVRLILKFS